MFVARLNDYSDNVNYGVIVCKEEISVNEFQNKIDEIKDRDIPEDWDIEYVFEILRDETGWNFEWFDADDELFI